MINSGITQFGSVFFDEFNKQKKQYSEYLKLDDSLCTCSACGVSASLMDKAHMMYNLGWKHP
jgi:hypothetical protein